MPKHPFTRRLLAERPDAYKYIADRLTPPCTRQHIRRTARQLDGLEPGKPSRRVAEAITRFLSRTHPS